MAISSVLENKAAAFNSNNYQEIIEQESRQLLKNGSVDDKLKFLGQLWERFADVQLPANLEMWLESLLSDHSVEVRLATVREVASLISRDGDYIFLLGMALRDEEVGVQAVALDVLRRNVELADRIMPSLVGILRQGDSVFRTLVLQIVSQLGLKVNWLFPAVCHCLSATDNSVFTAACAAVKSMTNDAVFTSIMRRVQSCREQSGQLNILIQKG